MGQELELTKEEAEEILKARANGLSFRSISVKFLDGHENQIDGICLCREAAGVLEIERTDVFEPDILREKLGIEK